MRTQQVQNNIANLFQMAKSTSVKQATGTSFDDLLQTSKINNQAEQESQDSNNTTVESSDTVAKKQKIEAEDSTTEVKQERPNMKDMEKAEETIDTEASDKELAERIAGFFNQVTETIKDMLGLSNEELQSFMEQMGITEVDLLNANTLQNLVLLVKEQEPVMLLTDAQLLVDVQNLAKQVESLLEQSGITREEISAFVEQTEFSTFVLETEEVLEQPEEVIKSSDLEVVSKTTEEMDTEATIEVKETTIEFPSVVDNGAKTATNHQENKDASANQNPFADQFLQNLQQVAEGVSEVSENTQLASQIREIADQILEKIKITVTPEITSFDMVLTPAELGRVNLTIVEQDGVMKASFVTENELAKEAIESNLVQFKEMLNEQGLKVDSIEVTVGNFEFNKNGQAEDGQEEQKRGKRRFQGEDTITTVGKDDDQLAQHFMDGGESTVNYMA